MMKMIRFLYWFCMSALFLTVLFRNYKFNQMQINEY